MERCSASLSLSSLPWIAVNTNPHRERMVLENLRREGLNAYGLKVKLKGEMVVPAYGSG